MLLRPHRPIALVAWLAAIGCAGDPNQGRPSGDLDSVCEEASPGSAPLRRLNGFEYNNTIRDLLGDDSRPADGFPVDPSVHGFDNQAEVLSVPTALAEAYQLAAEQIAERAVERIGEIVPCDLAADAGCADRFIASFGERAYRRPLTAADAAALRAVYDAGESDGGPTVGVQLTIETVLQSPRFLYRVEDSVEPDAPATPLDGYEMASRLSYLVWGSMPDDALRSAAAAGRLAERDAVEAEARRLLADPRSDAVIDHFFERWLGLAEILHMEKEDGRFDGYTPALRASMAGETRSFLRYVFREGRDARELFTADYGFLNQDLAEFYGIADVTGDDFVRVDLPPERGAGLLTQGGVLAAYSKYNQTSPIHRGKFVREQLLCDELLPPPPGTNPDPPPLDPSLTTRERFAQHSSDRACGGCHELIDPIGFTFEHFDAVGRWRDTEGDAAIDATGEVIASDIAGPIDGVVALGEALAGSDKVRACVVRQAFRFGYGRDLDDGDQCSSDLLAARLVDSGNDLRELFIGLTQTDAFFFKTGAN